MTNAYRRNISAPPITPWHMYCAICWFVVSAFVYVGATNGQTAESVAIASLEEEKHALLSDQTAIDAEVAAYRSLSSVRNRAGSLGYVPVDTITYVPQERTTVAVR
jgi:hypothetical protein